MARRAPTREVQELAARLGDDFLRLPSPYGTRGTTRFRTDQTPWLHVRFTRHALDSGAVLADLLEQEGRVGLGQRMSELIRELQQQTRTDDQLRSLFGTVYRGLVDTLWEWAEAR